MPTTAPVDSNRSPNGAESQQPLYDLSSKNFPSRVKPVRGPGFSWKRFFAMSFSFVFIAALTFGYLEYTTLRSNLIVKGEGNSSKLLSYSSTATNSDWNRFASPGDGRFNVLILGIGGISDSGVVHDGTLLTDSIQVFSLDTVNKTIGITSVPRDFYYNIPGHGANKINAAYEFGEMDQHGSGGQAAREAFGKVLGINISNFVVIDFTAAKDLINALGGIDITVPKALYDASFPCDDEVSYCPFSIAAGPTHMTGNTVLKYVRSRHADSDYGRSGRQQDVIGALKRKALSLGTLSNPVTVTNLLTTLSRHIKTDMQPAEITSFLNIYKDVPAASTVTNVLSTDSTLGLLTSKNDPYAGFISYPVGGYTAYGPIHQWFQKNNPDPFLAKEAATVSVASGGTATAKQMQAFMQKLQDYGFKATTSVLPASLPSSSSTQLFSKSDSSTSPVTSNYLGSVLGTSAQKGNPLDSGSDFEIIYAP
jgi:LCP family protein required for cell wall assembly